MLLHHLRYAWRTLTRNKGFTTIHIVGLATALCACIAIYTIAAYDLTFDTFHPGGDRIYRVGGRIEEHDAMQYGAGVPPPTAATIKKEIPGIETVTRYYPWSNDRSSNTIITDGTYFDIFQYQWLAGNPATALTRPFAVVLTEKQAQKYFGKASPDSYLNKAIAYNDSLHLFVSGIIHDWTGNTDFPYSDFISLSTIAPSFLNAEFRPDSWDTPLQRNPFARTFIRLTPHTSPEQIEAQFPGFVKRHIATNPFLELLRFTIVLQPLSDIHFNAAYSHDNDRTADKPAIYILMAVAGFILLLAIVNFINLSTAQFFKKAKETSIRRIMGSSRTQLLIRFFTETTLITATAAIIALLLVRPMLYLFRVYLPPDLHFHPFDVLTLLFVLGMILVTVLLAGAYPARLISRGLLPRNYTIRKVLLVFQFTISLLFIIGSIVVGKQLHFMLNADLGFAKDAVVTLTDFGVSGTKLRLFAQEARKIPGVADITLQGHAPAGSAIIEVDTRMDNRKDKENMVSLLDADERFLAFYHIPLLAGTNIRDNNVIINETYRRALGFQTPEQALGHSLTFTGDTVKIIGVIADFHTASLHDPIYPLLIGRLPNIEHSVGIRLTNLQPLKTALPAAWKKILPKKTFDPSFLDESIARLYDSDRRLSWLVYASTTVAIFISSIGLLGLILFIAERRKKELSIRKVLGAGIIDIVILINKDFAILVGIALLISTPIAWIALHHWLQNYASHIAVSLLDFAEAGLAALAITTLTILSRVVRAAKANPVEALSD